MLRELNPATIAAPASRYSLGVEAPAGCRWLYVSGQIGAAPDGTLATGFRDQAERAWENLLAVLKAGNMGLGDLVRINAFLARRSDIAAYREMRDRLLGTAKPASTVVIAELLDPAWLIEIEAVAAKEP